MYNTTSHFCCDESNGKCEEGKFHIYEDTEANKRKCWSSQVCRTEMQTNVVELTCSDSIYHGSHCDFTCPNGFDLAGIDQASCDPKTGVWENIWGQVIFFYDIIKHKFTANNCLTLTLAGCLCEDHYVSIRHFMAFFCFLNDLEKAE